MDWFKENKKKEGSIITTRVHEVLKTGVKVSVDPDKHIIVMIKKNQLAKESADARPEIFVPGNALDAMITELDLEKREVALSVKAAQVYEEKSLVAKFGVNAAKSGATLAGIFQKALGKKSKKRKIKKKINWLSQKVIKQLQKKHPNLNRSHIEAIVDIMFNTIIDSLAKGKPVEAKSNLDDFQC